MISFIQASGSVFMPVFILKENFKDADFVEPSFEINENVYNLRGYIRRYYAWNESGRLTSELFENIMDIFRNNWKTEHPGLNPLLFGDNLSAHKDIQVIKKTF